MVDSMCHPGILEGSSKLYPGVWSPSACPSGNGRKRGAVGLGEGTVMRPWNLPSPCPQAEAGIWTLWTLCHLSKTPDRGKK